MRYHWIFLYSLPHLASPSWIAAQWPQGHLNNSATVKRFDHIRQIQARQTPRISGKTENCSSSRQMWNVFCLAAKRSNDEHIPWGSGPTRGQEFPTSCWGRVLGDVGEEATARTVCLGILFRKERKEEEANFIQLCTRSENNDEVCEQISIHLDHSRSKWLIWTGHSLFTWTEHSASAEATLCLFEVSVNSVSCQNVQLHRCRVTSQSQGASMTSKSAASKLPKNLYDLLPVQI